MTIVTSTEKLSGIRIAGASIVRIFEDLRVFLILVAPWAAVALIAVLLAAAFPLITGGVPITAASFLAELQRLQEGDRYRDYMLIGFVPTTLAQIRSGIGWARRVLLGETPRGFFHMPKGSGRYFSRSLAVLFLFVLLLGAGALAGVLISIPVSVPEFRVAIFVLTIFVGLVAAVYFCARLNLVFPAIAVGDNEIDFSESYRITKGVVIVLAVATIVPWITFVLAGGLIAILPASLPFGAAQLALTILAEFLTTVCVVAATSASMGAAAIVYRSRVTGFSSQEIATLFD